MKLIRKSRLIFQILTKPFARPADIKSGMGPASEGNPTGYFH